MIGEINRVGIYGDGRWSVSRFIWVVKKEQDVKRGRMEIKSLVRQ